jgi:pimeloyl-ACP methyl ester carboxylesterase
LNYVDINGGKVAYDLLGPADGEPLVLTPGGRFGMDYPGVRPLGEALAAGGMRVLLWDRPNCGHSDVQFFGKTESHMRADTLAALLRELDLSPAVIAGGSGGARDSILTALLYPEVATKLAVWNIVGGIYGSLNLLGVYNMPSARAVKLGGMEAVIALPDWAELIELNPANRERFLALDPDEFFRVMKRWLNAFVPKAGLTLPGIDDEDFKSLTLPTLIIRGGVDDLDHPKRTSLEVSVLIKGSKLVEPPWPEDDWNEAVKRASRGEGGIFESWHMAAPVILEFVRSTGGGGGA